MNCAGFASRLGSALGLLEASLVTGAGRLGGRGGTGMITR